MEMNKSYHMIRAHEHGRCPTTEEYRDAIKYASKYPFEQKQSLRVCVAETDLVHKLMDWYVTVTTSQPAAWDNFKEQFQRMLIYYWVPWGDYYDSITPRMLDTMCKGHGDSWGGLSDEQIWILYREHMVTYLLHCGYTTSYLKNNGFMGQMMCTQIGKWVISWNENFGHLFGKSMPLMMVGHHTHPHVVNSTLRKWARDDVVDENGKRWGELHHVGEFHEQSNYLVDPDDMSLTRIRRKEQIPSDISNFERYYSMLDDCEEGDGNFGTVFLTDTQHQTDTDGNPIK